MVCCSFALLAAQSEVDDREYHELVKDVREALKDCKFIWILIDWLIDWKIYCLADHPVQPPQISPAQAAVEIKHVEKEIHDLLSDLDDVLSEGGESQIIS